MFDCISPAQHLQGVIPVKNPERVAALLAELRTLAETDFERHRIDVLERDLTSPPKVEVVDETHQKFDGFVYGETKSGHYMTGQSIHRALWIYANGEIPDGYHIHHIDGNAANNTLENLQLLSLCEHSKLHDSLNKSKSPQSFICEHCGRTFTVVSNGKKRRYCSTECMRQADKINQHKWTKICAWCGKEFKTRFESQKFCCHSCHMTERYANQKKEMVCPICGKVFTVKPSEKRETCSKSCAMKLYWQRRRETKS